MAFEAAIERLRSLNLGPSINNDDGDFEVLTGQMVPEREDQVQNNAGGFVFQVSDETRVRRFLILGVSSGTYYVNKSDLETENAKDLVGLIENGRGDMILKELYDVVSSNRAPKRDQAIYVLALCARFHSKNWQEIRKENNGKLDRADEYIAELQRAAFRLLPTVCRIPTDLFAFLGHCEKIAQEFNQKTTGWGRLMRKTIEQWYLNKPPMQLANQITKYKNRNNYTHKDALRLCHADPKNAPENNKAAFYDYIFHYAVSGKLDKKFDGYDDAQTTAVLDSDVAKFLNAVEVVSKLKPEDEEKCAQLIYECGLVREHCPTDLLNSSVVWKALLEKMPMTAMIRNLSKLSVLEIITGDKSENEKYVDKVVEALTNEQKLKQTGIHPMAILLAKSVYSAGRGRLGKLAFKKNRKIDSALDKSFTLAFQNVEPTGKRFCLALDVSGSMSQNIADTLLSCMDAEVGMALVTHRTEKNCEIVAFSDYLTPINITPEDTFEEFKRKIRRLHFQSTDCALPMIWAKEQKKLFDVFVIFTDNETYFGDVHPFKALQQYREASGIKDAKLIVMAFAATKFTIADPTDPNMLDICGFDAATPILISNFVLGRV
ncbi:hypothetical protein M3Y98_00589300 [Aphelenchoides besseyi]|nr:hypothetical protein M3Y98_00589300 [Aphelenchoides besseyi]KAI6193959.1 hypothetical protein M3Y96_01073900 [Aphelenchoides besseyi]